MPRAKEKPAVKKGRYLQMKRRLMCPSYAAQTCQHHLEEGWMSC